MADIFLNIFNMSVAASWLVLAVLILRVFMKKAPKWTVVLLWGIVALRLVFPFSIESALSLIPSAETVPPEIMLSPAPEINTGVPVLNEAINPIITESFAPAPMTSANPLQILIPVFSIVWVLGMVLLLGYTLFSYLRLRGKMSTAVLMRDNIYQSENVGSPFVLGIFSPKIYLPFGLDEQTANHVIAHENAHISRKDHLWKPLGFAILTVYWFNPIIWLAYILLCKDIELACDEKVIAQLGEDGRADYSEALLSCSVSRKAIAACPIAFGEVGVKERVKSVLNYKKPAFWVIVLAVIACIVVSVCFLTNPKEYISSGSFAEDFEHRMYFLSNDIRDFLKGREHTPTDYYRAYYVEGFGTGIKSEKGEVVVEPDNYSTVSIGSDYFCLERTEDPEGNKIYPYEYEFYFPGYGFIPNGPYEDYEHTYMGDDRTAFYLYKGRECWLCYLEDGEFILKLVDGSTAVRAKFTQNGREVTVQYPIPNGGAPTLRFDLPEGLRISDGEDYRQYEDHYDLFIERERSGERIGIIDIYPFAATDKNELAKISPIGDTMPLQIFGGEYEKYLRDYKLVSGKGSFGAAVAKYVSGSAAGWNDETGELSYSSQNCVLIYDWQVMDYFIYIRFNENTVSDDECWKITLNASLEQMAPELNSDVYKLTFADKLSVKYGVDEFEPNAYSVYLSGENEKSVAENIIPFASSNFYDPIVMLNSSTALIGYKYIYAEGEDEAKHIDLPFDYIFHASVSPDGEKIAYYAKEGNDIVISIYGIADGKFQNIKILAPVNYAGLTEMSPTLDWGDSENLYFDSPRNSKPFVEKYNLAAGTFSDVASEAKHPFVSDDNAIICYIEHDAYHTANEPMTVIKTAEKTQKFYGYSAIKYAEDVIYMIDYINSEVYELDYKTLLPLGEEKASEFPDMISDGLTYSVPGDSELAGAAAFLAENIILTVGGGETESYSPDKGTVGDFLVKTYPHGLDDETYFDPRNPYRNWAKASFDEGEKRLDAKVCAQIAYEVFGIENYEMPNGYLGFKYNASTDEYVSFTGFSPSCYFFAYAPQTAYVDGDTIAVRTVLSDGGAHMGDDTWYFVGECKMLFDIEENENGEKFLRYAGLQYFPFDEKIIA